MIEIGYPRVIGGQVEMPHGEKGILLDINKSQALVFVNGENRVYDENDVVSAEPFPRVESIDMGDDYAVHIFGPLDIRVTRKDAYIRTGDGNPYIYATIHAAKKFITYNKLHYLNKTQE